VRYKLRNDKDRDIHPWIDILLGDIQWKKKLHILT
jgi:hypothetical protein